MNDYKRSRTEVTIETHRVTTIRTRCVSRAVVHCDRCGQEVAPNDDTNALTIQGGDPKAISERCRDGKSHQPSDRDILGDPLVGQEKSQ